jgi:adenine phosphoribosyltransferase
VHIDRDALDDHKNLLIIDDLLAPGGTVIAALDLIRKFEAKNVVGAGFLVNLPALGGLEKLENLGIKSKYLVEF